MVEWEPWTWEGLLLTSGYPGIGFRQAPWCRQGNCISIPPLSNDGEL